MQVTRIKDKGDEMVPGAQSDTEELVDLLERLMARNVSENLFEHGFIDLRELEELNVLNSAEFKGFF